MACNYFCDGVDKAPQRSLFNALGMTKEEMDRPLVGIVSSYNEIVPGHMNIDKIVEAVKMGVAMAGGTPVVFPAIAVCAVFRPLCHQRLWRFQRFPPAQARAAEQGSGLSADAVLCPYGLCRCRGLPCAGTDARPLRRGDRGPSPPLEHAAGLSAGSSPRRPAHTHGQTAARPAAPASGHAAG